MDKSRNKKIFSNLFIVLAFFCFAIILYRVSYLATSTTIDDINIKEFAADRKIYEATIPATRGKILDVNGEILATTISTYKLIAYIDPVRSENEAELHHVKDKAKTAKELSKIINMSEKDILSILNQKDLYQVEFGFAGKNLTQSQKEKIDSLNLPGLDFIESKERYYPNGDFASYVLGYARQDINGTITGELGLESVLDKQLKGKDGYTSYQSDVNNYKIAGTKEIFEKAVNGYNVYLTLDYNIQYIVEQALSSVYKKYKSDWMVVVVADAKTGEILATSQKPSFNPNPNELNIENYLDLTVAEPYEPGSIMKTYTYMAAMEAGTYKGDKTYKSGSYKLDDGTIIYDWNKSGFGTITYDQGYMASSNVGIINILNNFINKDTLHKYFRKLGFGEKTNITLANEQAGKVTFNYDSEVYNAGFGQGITTTPMQHIKALTSISNDGVMLEPYIISKVVSDSGETIYEGKRKELGIVASHETVNHMKDLMYETIYSSWVPATGDGYAMKGYDLIGKTGTAQLVDSSTGKYYLGDYFSVKSFVGMWPKDDPEIIIYASIKKSASGSTPLTSLVKAIVKNVSTYLNVFGKPETKIENYETSSYLNKDVKEVIEKLKNNKISYVVLGTGSKIINQYPKENYLLSSNDKLILVTNSASYNMISLTGYSKKEVRAICDMLSLECTLENYGYATSQSIASEKIINKNDKLTVKFKDIY